MKQLAVFTDLDGTLLDHHTYGYKAALPAIARLNRLGIALFAVSSKTLAEQLSLFEQHAFFTGYIAENGGVLHYRGHTQNLGPTCQVLQDCLKALEQHMGLAIKSFRSGYEAEVAQATGLSKTQASLACQRVCSAPLFLHATPEQLGHLRTIADQHGLELVHGGRFPTLCGKVHKGMAMQAMLKQHFGQTQQVITIALGDSENDLPMLQAAQYGVLMPNASGKGVPGGSAQGLIVAPQPGPVGWAQVVNGLLDQLL
ncbi:MAG: HAD-IIB family hydrolase [Limnobacter sp.]|nr:HAD-IIB family hydrolase [Limnobacter sp.]